MNLFYFIKILFNNYICLSLLYFMTKIITLKNKKKLVIYYNL